MSWDLVRSDVQFERLLWPTRFYDGWNPGCLLEMTLLTTVFFESKFVQ